MEIFGKLIDDRIIEYLNKTQNFKSQDELTKYLFPNKSDFLDPYDLKNMNKVVCRLNNAIKQKENILIYGDYDCDGICSATMLYMFLKSRGLNSHVFIPDRFEDGYGMSDSSINKICSIMKNGIVITVDCGISCSSQIDKLLSLGYEVIVTDHHEPSENLPNCLIIDPKFKDQNYSFDGLSGAGVVFKLIHAMSSLDEAFKYIDICAISTVGDIVPLISENRIITKYGIQMLNSENTKPFVKFLKEKLSIKEIDSTELSFKIVPRINASGRMDNSQKCFEFFNATDRRILEEKYNLIEIDNNLRLSLSNEIFTKLNSYLSVCNFNTDPAIFVYDKSINLGIIGIIASKLCSQYHRPVFIFSDSENGNIKGSVRSVTGINIFEVMSKFKDLLIDIGGHELAGGLTISHQNFEIFREKIQSYIKTNFDESLFVDNCEADIKITEKDLGLKFIDQIELLEPFGHKNRRPICLLEGSNFTYSQMKSFQHYKIITYNKKEIISFFGNKYQSLFATQSNKKLFIEMSHDTFLGKHKAKMILKSATGVISKVDNEINLSKIKNLGYILKSINQNQKSLYKKFNNISEIKSTEYGYLYVADSYSTYVNFIKSNKILSGFLPNVSGKTMILYNPFLELNKNNILMYKNVVFLDGEAYNNQYNFLNKNIYVNSKNRIYKTKKLNREEFALIFKLMKNIHNLSANNFLDLVLTLKSRFKTINETHIAFVLAVSINLGFVTITNVDDKVNIEYNKNSDKKSLNSSEIYNI